MLVYTYMYIYTDIYVYTYLCLYMCLRAMDLTGNNQVNIHMDIKICIYVYVCMFSFI